MYQQTGFLHNFVYNPKVAFLGKTLASPNELDLYLNFKGQRTDYYLTTNYFTDCEKCFCNQLTECSLLALMTPLSL